MAEKIKLNNNTNKKIEILIKLSAEYLDIVPDNTIIIEFTKVRTEFRDVLSMALENDMLIIYESR